MKKIFKKLYKYAIFAAAPSFNFGTLGNFKPGATNVTDLGSLISVIVTWMLGLAGAFAVIAILYSGIMYITAGGDAEKAATARKNLLWAVIGVIIVVLVFTVFNLITEVLTSP